MVDTLAIVGAGPNLGMAVARAFGKREYAVGLISRRQEALDELADQLKSEGITAAGAAADVREHGATVVALADLEERLGPIDVLVYSPLPALNWIMPVLDTPPGDLRSSLELSVVGAAGAVRAVLPGMRERRRGTLLFTTGGAAVDPHPDRAASAIAYAGEVTYARLLHEALAGDGIHVGHVAIVGALGPGQTHEPTDIAELLWRQHVERQDFQTVVRGQ
ncbi:MAG: SDR family NAD(P)-dependent oxidoreductase [Mycobacteriales bacterium]